MFDKQITKSQPPISINIQSVVITINLFYPSFHLEAQFLRFQQSIQLFYSCRFVYITFLNFTRLQQIIEAMMNKNTQCKEKVLRGSKISQALRTAFLRQVFEDGKSVKKASLKYKLNYSTAKVIAQNYKKNGEDSCANEKINIINCMNIKNDHANKTPPSRFQSQYREIKTLVDSSSSQNTVTSRTPKIDVVSTIAWNFMQKGIPKIFELSEVKQHIQSIQINRDD